jgi:hypothetical protein
MEALNTYVYIPLIKYSSPALTFQNAYEMTFYDDNFNLLIRL